ncbi:hypothetical protein [Vagococcus carniphilus]|uniref:hypothetical protein n=1 Tax=Vagococcus carniphilus TaxID=218144 RepID=UPI003B5931FF
MDKRIIKGLGIFLILIACIILLSMNNFIFPIIEDGSIDTGEYYLRIFINALRFIVLAIISSSIGIKLLFKD